MRTALAVLAVLAAAAIPSAASGADLPGSDTDLALAQQAWGGAVPACGVPRMYDVEVPATTYDTETPPRPLGPMEAALDAGTIADATTNYGECGILWDSWNRWQASAYGWCVTIVHEYGHLLDHDHNGNRRSVMYEGGPWWAHVPVCDAYLSPGRCTEETSLHGRVITSYCRSAPRRARARGR